MPSMNEAFGHVRQIEKVDREFYGFLTIFSTLTHETKDKVLTEIARLKQEFGKDKEGFLDEVKALAEMYGALDKRAKNWTSGADNNLTFKLGEMSSVLNDIKLKQNSNQQPIH